MAHRALTLKYRPQVFADMVGQDHVSTVISRAIESGRIAHAYLFTGARGVGKTTSARILAKSLNCERRASGELKGADPCNACTSCLEITNGISLDVSEIDGASNRGIADVQALREKVRFSPTGGRYRVVIIDEVHQLSNDAFAALLKTLEEPPPHLVFIFATTDPQKLPDTIRSRTQRFDYARVPLRKVADRLLDIARREAKDPEGVHFDLTEGAAILIAHKSEGALRDAVSALDQVISSGETEIDEERVRRILGLADREAFFDLAGAIVARDPKEALHALHRAFDKGLDARDLAEGLSQHIRHILILKIDPDGAELVAASGEDVARLRSQGDGWSENDLLRLLRIASEVLFTMRDSPQPLVHLEAAILQMATLEPGETLNEILQRLESLEQRLAGGAKGAVPGPSSGRAPGPVATPRPAGRPAASGPPRAMESDPVSAVSSVVPPQARPVDRVIATAPAPVPVPARAATTVVAPAATTATAHAAAAVAPPERRPATAAAPVLPRATATTSTAPIAIAVAEVDEWVLTDEVERQWRDVVAGIYALKPMLGAFLEESRFLGSSAVALRLATDDLHRSIIEDKENRAMIGVEVMRVFGRMLPLQCAAADLVPLAAPVAKPEETQQMIDRAVEWFQGESVTPPERRPIPSPRRERNDG